jgi:hypothetical protein
MQFITSPPLAAVVWLSPLIAGMAHDLITSRRILRVRRSDSRPVHRRVVVAANDSRLANAVVLPI